jgi:hypothetical protein
MHEIEKRWGVPISTVSRWIKRTGSFKLRRTMGIRTYSQIGAKIPDSNERVFRFAAAVDKWAAAEADKPNRSDAIRRLAELGLKVKQK